MANVRGCLRNTQEQPEKLRRCFYHPGVRYVAAMSKRYPLAP